jgi:hypothetical protein
VRRGRRAEVVEKVLQRHAARARNRPSLFAPRHSSAAFFRRPV